MKDECKPVSDLLIGIDKKKVFREQKYDSGSFICINKEQGIGNIKHTKAYFE